MTATYEIPANEAIVELAKEAGAGAADWMLAGNAAYWGWILNGIRVGDPEVLDFYGTPVLEDGDQVGEILEIPGEIDMGAPEIAEAVALYAQAANDEFWTQAEAMAVKELTGRLAEDLDEVADKARAHGLNDDEILGAVQAQADKWDEDSALVQGRGWSGVVEGTRAPRVTRSAATVHRAGETITRIR